MTQLYHKPCLCSGCQGRIWYSEQEDYNPGSEPEWSLHCSWSCDTCGEYISQCEDRFTWPDED